MNVDQAQAVWPDETHAALFCSGQHAFLVGDAFRPRFAKTTAQHYGKRYGLGAALLDDAGHMFRRDGDHNHIARLINIRKTVIAAVLAKRVVIRVDRKNSAA